MKDTQALKDIYVSHVTLNGHPIASSVSQINCCVVSIPDQANWNLKLNIANLKCPINTCS